MSGYTANVSFSVPVDLLQEVDRRAQEEGVPRSRMLRTLVESAVTQKQVNKNTNKKGGKTNGTHQRVRLI